MLDSTLIYQALHELNHIVLFLQISLNRLCAVKLSYLSDTNAF
jgi:hypothetical protein